MAPALDDHGSLEEALDSLSEGLQVISRDWRYLYVNAAAALHGRKAREELVGRTMMECYPGIERTEMFELLTRCMENRKALSFENEFTFADGKRAWFELRIKPFAQGIAVLSIDITERKRLEVTLRQSQKMDALGRLAGGVAHDFNNMLTVITSYASFLKSEMPEGSPLRADLNEILAAVDKSARLSSQLLTFGKNHPIAPRTVSLNEVVLTVETMLRRVLRQDIEIKTALEPKVHPVRLDVNAFEQVIVNLSLNSRDAMPNGGVLTLETQNVAVDESYVTGRGGVVPPGDYACLIVSDTGHGMTEEVQQCMFEPFFTTKPKGEGSGLGLATSYGIIRQARGYVWVYSEVDRGTSFKIYLPRADAQAATDVRTPALRGATSGTILVVEDDPQVRNIVLRALGQAGYEIVSAANAVEAEERAKERNGRFDLLLTDVVMPGMSGVELAQRLTALYPSLPVLFMSGYTKNALEGRTTLTADVQILQKPFTPDGLLRAVSAALKPPELIG